MIDQVMVVETLTANRFGHNRQHSCPVDAPGWPNPKFPARVYGYGPTALPFFIVQRICRLEVGKPWVHDRLLLPQDPRLAPRRFGSLGQSAGQAVWPQRSGGQAASVGTGSGSEKQPWRVAKQFASLTTVASNSRCLLDRDAPTPHHGSGSTFIGAEGPKRALNSTAPISALVLSVLGGC